MAYKDEYEVARLHASPGFKAHIAEQFTGDYQVHYHLAPPLLAKHNAHGLPTKRRFGPWMGRVFALLQHGKILRGTPLDPFGYTAERRLERRLIAQYTRAVAELAAGLTQDNLELAIEIASLPEHIRGFGHIKERHWQEVEARWQALMARWRNPSEPDGVQPAKSHEEQSTVV
jgi:indolepyruvate ferredoxin oxidoreductase